MDLNFLEPVSVLTGARSGKTLFPLHLEMETVIVLQFCFNSGVSAACWTLLFCRYHEPTASYMLGRLFEIFNRHPGGRAVISGKVQECHLIISACSDYAWEIPQGLEHTEGPCWNLRTMWSSQ